MRYFLVVFCLLAGVARADMVHPVDANFVHVSGGTDIYCPKILSISADRLNSGIFLNEQGAPFEGYKVNKLTDGNTKAKAWQYNIFGAGKQYFVSLAFSTPYEFQLNTTLVDTNRNPLPDEMCEGAEYQSKGSAK